MRLRLHLPLGAGMRVTLLLFVLSALAACHDGDRPLPAGLDGPQFMVSALAGLTGRIAWNTDRDGGPDQDIWIMNADGSRATQLTENTGIDDGSPRWSPDGQRIVFHSTRDGDYEVYIMNADGSGVARLTDNASGDLVPAWSPDGKKLVFVSDRDGDLEIFTMNADGTGVSQLTHNACTEYNPAWSPGGKQIAFRSDCDGDAEIYVINADGTGLTQRTNNTGFQDDGPAWSPDGKRLAFASDRDGDWEIYVMNADGTGVTQLTNNIGATDFIPAWSPDGKHLVFTSDRDGDFELFVMNADGTGVTQLTNDGFADFGLDWTSGNITSPSTQFHFVSNGDFGSVSWFAPDPAGGFTFGSISVSRGGPTNAPQTSLSYFVFQCDPFGSCTDVRDGFGLIPNTDLSGGGRALSVRTNTSGNPNFVTFAGPTGPVSVDWRANGLFTQSSSGTNQITFPGVTQTFQGGSTSASANAAGSIVGVAISPNGFAGIGTNRQMTIDITRTNALGVAARTLTADGSGPTALTSMGGSLPLLLVGTTGTATQFHFVANGDLGSVSWFDPSLAGGFTFGSLSVSRGGPTTNPQTFLSYFVFECDATFSCSVTRDGFGLIPNGDLSGGRTSLRLSTNTTGNPNFVTFAGPSGVVSVDWRANGLFTQSSSGTNQISFPGFTQQFQGGSTAASANAAGSIVGLAISPNGSATIGTNHQVTIDISH